LLLALSQQKSKELQFIDANKMKIGLVKEVALLKDQTVEPVARRVLLEQKISEQRQMNQYEPVNLKKLETQDLMTLKDTLQGVTQLNPNDIYSLRALNNVNTEILSRISPPEIQSKSRVPMSSRLSSGGGGASNSNEAVNRIESSEEMRVEPNLNAGGGAGNATSHDSRSRSPYLSSQSGFFGSENVNVDKAREKHEYIEQVIQPLLVELNQRKQTNPELLIGNRSEYIAQIIEPVLIRLSEFVQRFPQEEPMKSIVFMAANNFRKEWNEAHNKEEAIKFTKGFQIRPLSSNKPAGNSDENLNDDQSTVNLKRK